LLALLKDWIIIFWQADPAHGRAMVVVKLIQVSTHQPITITLPVYRAWQQYGCRHRQDSNQEKKDLQGTSHHSKWVQFDNHFSF